MWGGGVDDKKKFRTWMEGKKKIRKGAWVGLVKKKIVSILNPKRIFLE